MNIERLHRGSRRLHDVARRMLRGKLHVILGSYMTWLGSPGEGGGLIECNIDLGVSRVYYVQSLEACLSWLA